MANAGVTHVWLPPASQSAAPEGISPANSVTIYFKILDMGFRGKHMTDFILRVFEAMKP